MVDTMWQWYESTRSGEPEARNASIYMLDNTGYIPTMIWNLTNAVPVQWSGPDLKSDQDNVAFESITLVFEELDKPPMSQVASIGQGVLQNAARLL